MLEYPFAASYASVKVRALLAVNFQSVMPAEFVAIGVGSTKYQPELKFTSSQ